MATVMTSPPTPGAKGPRMCKAVVDLGGDIMRDALYHQITPKTILAQIASSPFLKKKPLSPVQMKILSNTVTSGDYKDCDITLTYSVLRNCKATNAALCPTKGWGKVPVQPGDVKLGDDIERIREIRNAIYGHVATTDMSDAVYNTYMQQLQDICYRMDVTHLPLLKAANQRSRTYSQRLTEIQTCCMDPDTEEKYRRVLQMMALEEKETKEKLDCLSGMDILCTD